MPYSIRLPDGSLVQNIPDDLPPEEAKKRIIAAGLVKVPEPETTALGQVKEAFKGLVFGAVGPVESAAIGASALLPDELEKAAREKIASIAGAAKAPFAAAPGYEQTIGRKLVESVGSTLPFFAAGPLGLAGRAAAVGLGVGAGAGEARTRAEKEGATEEQRATATALGVIPGAMEVFAPFRILKRIPEGEVLTGVQMVKRAAIAGGEEGAQEAASNFAQNLIARGVYKPEQELIEGLGESAAYGGAAGAIIQGVMDLALGRRAKGAAPAPTEEDEIDRLRREQTQRREEAAQARAVPPVPDTNDYAALIKYSEEVKQLPKSKERNEALKQAREQRLAIVQAEVEANRLSAEKAKEFMTAEEAATAEIQRRDELEPKGESTTEKVEEPKVREKGVVAEPAAGLTSEDISGLGITKKQPIAKRLLGKDMADPEQRTAVLADIENYLVRGLGSEESRAKLTEFKAQFEAQPTTETPTTPEVTDVGEVIPETGGVSPGVVGESGAGAAPERLGEVEPSGVVPTVEAAGESSVGEGRPSVAVTEEPAAFTPAQRESLAEDFERISGRIPVEEYDALVENHLDESGSRVRRGPEHVQAIKNALTKYGAAEPEIRRAGASGAVDPQVTKGAAEGDIVKALEGIKYSPETSGLDRTIAQRLLTLGKYLTLPKIEIVDPSQIKTQGKYDTDRDLISIASNSVDSHTVLHETVHAFVHKLIVANELGRRNDAGYRDLNRLYEFLNKNHPELQSEYGMRSVTEFASEAQSNQQFQEKLRQIKYQNRSAWSAFVQAVRKLLKVAAGDSNALVEAIASVDSILRVGREYQTQGPTIKEMAAEFGIDVSTPAVSKAPTLVGEKEETVSWADRTLGENKVIGARVKFADTQAGLAARLAPLFGGKVRSKAGELNPEFQMARALDWGRFSLAMQEEGMLKRDPDGLAVVQKLTVDESNFSREELARLSLIQGQDVSVVKAFQKIAQSKTSKEKIDELLAGEREYQLYQNREELEEKGKELKFFYTEEQAKALHEEFMANEDARVVGQMLDAVRFKMIDFLVDTGRWSAEKGADMKAALGYMPFQRISALDANYEGRGTRRGAAVFRNLKKYEGSEVKQVRSPTEAFSNLMDWMTAEGMKNEATSRSLDVLSLVGAAKYVGDPKLVDNAEKYKVVTSYDKGVKKFYFVNDPAIVPAFNVAPVEFSSIIKLMQRGSRILRAGVTSTPPFVYKQVVDDITRLYALSKLENPTRAAATMLLNFPKNWFNELRGAKSASLKELERVGVVGTYDFTEEGNVTHIMEKGDLSKPGTLAKVLRIMEAGAKASDISVRQAIYAQAQKEGKDKATAEYMAREIINFSRRGSSRAMDYFIRTIPFFNAFAQGFDKLVAAAGGRAVGMNSAVARATFWQRVMVLTALGTMYALLMSDDEEYNNLSDHVRDRNFIIPFNKEFVEKYGSVPAIPIPADLAFLFKVIPERFIQYIRNYGTDEERSALQMTKELMLAGFDVFSSPNLTPQLIRPIFENYINHSFFLGRPLESQSQQRVSAYLREGMGTSDTMKAVAEGLDRLDVEISPIKLENFVRGMFGSIAGTVLAIGDTLINPSRTDRPLHLMLGSQLTGASAFMKDALSSKSMERLYNLEKKTVQAYTGLNKLIEENRLDELDRHYAENYGLLQVHDEVQELMRLVGDLSRIARQIDKDTSMAPEERRQMINELRIMQNEYSREIARIDYRARQAQLEFDKQ